MDKLMEKLYEQVIVEETDMQNMKKNLDKEIQNLISSHFPTISADEKEILLNVMYIASFQTEKKSFAMGFRYAVRLLLNLYFPL